MSTIKANAIENVAGTTRVSVDQIGVGAFKNKLINGGFDIWQRGTSQTVNDYGCADRWTFQGSGGGITASKQSYTIEGSVVNGVRYGLTTADDNSRIEQKIEDVTTGNGKNVTASFWLKSDASRTLRLYIIQNFGSGGSASVLQYVDFNVTTSFTKYEFTFSLPSTEGKTIGDNSRLNFSIYNTTSETYLNDIASVQLEEGTEATPFEQRPIGMELSLCQRYFETGLYRTRCPVGYNYKYYKFQTPKRETATMTYSNLGTWNSILYGLTGHDEKGYYVSHFQNSEAVATVGMVFDWAADAEL